MATNECVKGLESINHRPVDLGMIDGSKCTQVYHDNQPCIQWSAYVTSEGIRHYNLCKNMVRELHQDNSIHMTHIPGVTNPSDIFTEEMRDSAHFPCLYDIMMVSLEGILQLKILPCYSIQSPQDMESYATSLTASTPSLNKVSLAL